MLKIIFYHLLGYSQVDIILHKDSELSEYIHTKIDNILERLVAKEPIQYVVGEEIFHGHRFKVTRDTLIPRPETQQLVDIIIDEYGSKQDLRVLDIGTGSGCIAISLAKALKFANIDAFDISEDALSVATANAKTLRANVHFLQTDILTATPPQDCYDIIVSNPPYICNNEKAEMDNNVLDYEPHLALFVPVSNPLLFYRAIAEYAICALKNGGKLYFEINSAYPRQMTELLESKGFVNVEIMRDMYNRPRFAVGLKPTDL